MNSFNKSTLKYTFFFWQSIAMIESNLLANNASCFDTQWVIYIITLCQYHINKKFWLFVWYQIDINQI